MYKQTCDTWKRKLCTHLSVRQDQMCQRCWDMTARKPCIKCATSFPLSWGRAETARPRRTRTGIRAQLFRSTAVHLTAATTVQITHSHGSKQSRVCAVAQYAVLEANAKVNGRSPFPHPSETPQPISMSCQTYYYVLQGSWRAKFGWNRLSPYGPAHAWKNTTLCGFFLSRAAR